MNTTDHTPTSPLSDCEQLFQQGIDLFHQRQFYQAIEYFQRALELQPDNTNILNNLGLCLSEAGRLDQALVLYKSLLETNQTDENVLLNLGNVYERLGRMEEATACFDSVLKANPNNPNALYNLGSLHIRQLRLHEGIALLRRASQLQPDNDKILANLALAFRNDNRPDEACALLERAITREPEDPELHWDYAMSLLQNGDFLRGFKEYPWRWKTTEFKHRIRPFMQPRWSGENLEGKTLLIYTEQGFGDALQFSRFLPLVKNRGASIVLECHRELADLFDVSFTPARTIQRGDPLPTYDFQIPLMDVPGLLGIAIETLPVSTSYLRVPEPAAKKWRGYFPFPGTRSPKLRLGLVRSGSAERKLNEQRSCPQPLFKDILNVEGYDFYNLQISNDPLIDEISRSGIIDLTPNIHDFSDTAALIDRLDLVLTVDTAVAHLAAALGKLTWILLDYAASWQWMTGSEESVWYPTAKLFRQSRPNDWQPLIERVMKELVLFRKRKTE
jgi:Flp pilus assembly protein TadD